MAVNLGLTTAQNTGAEGTDTLINIENLRGSGFNDTLTGSGLGNNIQGRAGNDSIRGMGGNDSLFGIRLHQRAVAKGAFPFATDPTETIKDSNDNGMIGRHESVGA